ncbi:MAG: pilus assembly protein [Oscillospiraceae bacterium]|nr:pilus assembly protein [Oscillospiraceae bacterium]
MNSTMTGIRRSGSGAPRRVGRFWRAARTYRKLVEEETAAASIVEYSIVLPLCLIVLLFIFFVGYVLNQRALLDSAAHRGVLLAQQYYADPNYNNIVDLGLTEAKRDYVGHKSYSMNVLFENDPYRFLNKNYHEDMIRERMEGKITSVIGKNQLFLLDNRLTTFDVDIPGMEGFLNKSAEVTITQRFYLPLLLGHVNLEPVYTMTAKSRVTVTTPAEFVRNTDFVIDTIEKYTGTDVTEKLVTFFAKITDFFKSG